MRRSFASVDQVLYSLRHRGRRAAAQVVVDRARRLRQRLHLSFQYPDVVWGRNVQLRGKVRIAGLGSVHIGDHVVLDGRSAPVILVASFEDSRIEIGAASALSGSRLIAAGAIRVGNGCILAQCRLMDNDWHRLDGVRRGAGPLVDPAPVVVGDNVWIAEQVIVTRGVRIGDGASIGAASVVRRDVPAGAVVVGNPQRLVRIAPDEGGLGELGELVAVPRPGGTGPLDLPRLITLLEDATQSVPGTISPESRLDDPELWDSLSVLTLTDLLAAETGLEVTVEELVGCVTPAALLAELHDRQAT